jgi:hypothetical protein
MNPPCTFHKTNKQTNKKRGGGTFSFQLINSLVSRLNGGIQCGHSVILSCVLEAKFPVGSSERKKMDMYKDGYMIDAMSFSHSSYE